MSSLQPISSLKRKAEVELPSSVPTRNLWKRIPSLLRSARGREIAEALNHKSYNSRALDSLLEEKRISLINKFWRDSDGNTIAHYAAELGYKNRIQELQSKMFPLHLKNNRGETPLEVYQKGKNRDCSVERLLSESSESRKKRGIAQIPPLSIPDSLPLMYPEAAPQARIHPGRFATDNLTLYYQNKRRECEIPDRSFIERDTLSLHDRMKLETSLRTGDVGRGSDNFVMASIGFIVSTKPHAQKREGDYRVKFISLPINHPRFSIYAQKDFSIPVHSEIQLYRFLEEKETAEALLTQLASEHQIAPGFKIYGVVLDLYTSRSMCGDCEGATYDQMRPADAKEPCATKILDTMEQVCSQKGYILPKNKRKFPPDALTPSRSYLLHFAARVSASFPYGRSSPEDSVGVSYPAFGELRYEEKEFLSTKESRNIKRFRNNVILHRKIALPPAPIEQPSLPEFRTQTLFQNTHPSRRFACICRI